jgi:dUTP pyrophosphatase
MIPVKFKKLHPDAVLPRYAHGPAEDAGMDLVASEAVSLEQYTPTLVKTGLALELPPGFEAQVRPRSGLALKHGVTVWNSPGTIDPSYRGEVGVILFWAPLREQWDRFIELRSMGGPLQFRYEINPGDRIAQVVFASYEAVRRIVVDELAESERGSGGFGSTGV